MSNGTGSGSGGVGGVVNSATGKAAQRIGGGVAIGMIFNHVTGMPVEIREPVNGLFALGVNELAYYWPAIRRKILRRIT